MSPLLFLLMADFTPFVLVDRKDPITDERELALAASADGNMIAVGCQKPGAGDIFVRFVPERYYGPAPDEILWKPNMVYRFGNEEAQKTEWGFYSNYIELGFIWSPNKAKAKFLDSLSKNDRLILRYEARPGQTETLVINYQLNNENLSSVISKCAPKKVSEYLREWNSPALIVSESK